MNFGLLLLILTMNVVGQAYSALRFGSDLSRNDLSIEYIAQISSYIMIFKNDFDYIALPFSICFRHSPVYNQLNGSCILTNNTEFFDCLSYNLTNLPLFHWNMSADYNLKGSSSYFKPKYIDLDGSNLVMTFSLDGVLYPSKKAFSFLSEQQSFYEVISINSYEFFNKEEQIKKNYVSTFSSGYSVSDNLLMQRNWECFVHEQIVIVLFMGGVFRGGKDVFIISFINYHLKKEEFLSWQALSFSNGKVNRDYLGVFASKAVVMDLFSLYKTAPFMDTSLNIGGRNDWILTGTSSSLQGKPSWYYFTQAYRYYQTADVKGDEVICFKINNSHCYAAHFLHPLNDTSFLGFTESSITQVKYMHQILKCFVPRLEIFGEFLEVYGYMILLISLLY